MVLLGSSVEGRFIEQHDIFFGIAENLNDLKDAFTRFWNVPGLHVDAWREVNVVDNYHISVVEKSNVSKEANLYFINLGGYRENEFEEFHFKMLIVAADQKEAVKKAKQTVFFKETGFEGASAHIEDKYGVDVDDLYNVEDILPADMKQRYSLNIRKAVSEEPDNISLGYLPLSRL